MKTLHPRVLEQIQAQLPKDSVILGTQPGDEDVGYVVVQLNNDETMVPIPKKDIGDYMGVSIPELPVGDQEPLAQVFKRLSNAFKLFLVEGVDYTVPEGKVDLPKDSPSPFQMVTLEIAPTSILWKGRLVLKLLNKARLGPSGILKATDLDTPRLQMALSSKIFQGNGNLFTENRSRLSDTFCQQVVDYLNAVKIQSVTVDRLKEGELIDNVSDCFSGLVIIKLEEGPHLFIRYRSEGEEDPQPSPGDVDPE